MLLKLTAKKSMKKTVQSSFYYWNGTGMIEEPLVSISTGESELVS